MLYKGTQPICPIVTVGTQPVVETLTVTPSTTTQTLTPPSGTDGYNTIKVSAVTSAIDSDIVASNIKSGVNILGVSGTVTQLVGQTMTVDITSTDTTSSIINVFTPSSGYNGIKKIKVRPTLKPLTITPTTTTQTFYVPSGYSGYGTVTCSAASGGTTPTLITKTITTNGTYNASSDNADGYSSVSVNVAGTSPSGTYTITTNGTYDVTNYASADVSVSGGLPGWTTLSSISVDCSVEEIVDYNYDLDVTIFQQYVASIIPANSMYISTTTFDFVTQGITAFIINDVTHFWGSMANDDIYIAVVNSIQPEFQYSAINYRLLFQTDVETTIENGEITIPGCGLEVYDANYDSYQLAAVIDLTFHFNV